MSSGDKSCAPSANSLSSRRDGASAVATMRDVAAAAGVSIATVSNVLNNPHLVSAWTRTRVEKAIHALNFQPDPHARELRGRSRTGASVKNSRTHLDGDHSTNEPEDASDGSAMSEVGQVAICGGAEVRSGEHVTVQVGSEILSGTVDAVMPDNSYFWIWTDSGMGRRLIEAADVSTKNELTWNKRTAQQRLSPAESPGRQSGFTGSGASAELAWDMHPKPQWNAPCSGGVTAFDDELCAEFVVGSDSVESGALAIVAHDHERDGQRYLLKFGGGHQRGQPWRGRPSDG